MKRKMTTREIAYIALSIAVMISGGLVIVSLAKTLPFPGVKYIVMSPFIAFVLYIVTSKVKNTHTILMAGMVLGGIMSLMNVVMGLAIATTTLLTHFSLKFLKSSDTKNKLGPIIFSAYMGLVSVTLAKFLIGGAFEVVSSEGIVLIGILCGLASIGGVFMGMKVIKLIR